MSEIQLDMLDKFITFNKPYCSGKEIEYIKDAIESKKLSGNGKYSKLCHDFFNQRYGFEKCLLTSSCTDALEMTALLANIGPGDEVIMPSYTFVSTANAFVLRGAKVVFIDSGSDNPNMDAGKIEEVITSRTKAIVVVHYAGVACDMDRILDIATKNNLLVIEDAAQAIDSYYNGKPLGSLGDMATFSFHETKNIISGEGGLLVVNNPVFQKRAEILWEKGTNRAAFFRGEVDKYGWVDLGSSFLPSELTASYLYAQLESLEDIQKKRVAIWKTYDKVLRDADFGKRVMLPNTPAYATNNAHMYYLVFDSLDFRQKVIAGLRDKSIHSVFHYLSLHKSEFYKNKHDGRELKFSDYYTEGLLRLPMYYDLSLQEARIIAETLVDVIVSA